MNDKATGELLESGLTNSVIRSFFDVHQGLGFGYREFIYALALERDLMAKGHHGKRPASQRA
ncbi:MAG TPA: GxxExxY protein [Gemmatimonadaceae bacterium]